LGLARKLCVNACRKLDRGGKAEGSVAAPRMMLGAKAKSGSEGTWRWKVPWAQGTSGVDASGAEGVLALFGKVTKVAETKGATGGI
jgi:hypothetical protein